MCNYVYFKMRVFYVQHVSLQLVKSVIDQLAEFTLLFIVT